MLDLERSRRGGETLEGVKGGGVEGVVPEELDMAYLYFVNRIQGWARPGSII